LTEEKKTLEKQVKELQARCNDFDLVKQELKAVTAERNELAREKIFLKTRARRSEAKCDAMRKSIDGLKTETEESRAEIKRFVPLQSELNVAKQNCENIKKQRNSFILRAHRTEKTKENVEFERDALKREVEELRARLKETEELKAELQNQKMKSQELKSERDHFKSKFQWKSESRKAMEKKMDDMTLEIKKLRARCEVIPVLQKELKDARQECESATKERNSFILRAQRVRKERDALKVEAEETRISVKENVELQSELSTVKERFKNVKKQRNSLILKARSTEADKEAMMVESAALKRVVQDLQAQGSSAPPPEGEFHTPREHCSNFSKDRMGVYLRDSDKEEQLDIELPIEQSKVADVGCYRKKCQKPETIEAELIEMETGVAKKAKSGKKLTEMETSAAKKAKNGKELIEIETVAAKKAKNGKKLKTESVQSVYSDAVPLQERVHTLRESYGDLTQVKDCLIHGEKRHKSHLLGKRGK
jgi:chromosome segregation ATPase